MQLMIAAAPPLRQMACGTQLPIANAAYRIENGVLCALPMPPALRGGAMLLTGAAGLFSPETAAGVVQECRRRRYGTRVLVCTALSGGDIENRLSACCRAFGPDRIVLDLQRLRMDFPLPCPTGEGIPLTDEQLAALQTGRQIFFSRELGARYFTYRRGGETRFVLLDDGDTLHRKIALGERLGIHRGLLTLPECADILRDLTG